MACRVGIIALVLLSGCSSGFRSVDRNPASGGMTGSGGDIIYSEHNPWFIGPQPVRWCLDLRSDVSLDQEKARTLILKAIRDWQSTLRSVRDPYLVTYKVEERVSLSFVEVSCAASTELRFQIGGESPHLYQGDQAHSVAYAKRVSYDETKRRARGVVWLAPDKGMTALKALPILHFLSLPHRPDTNSLRKPEENFWARDSTFYNVILHELGHVFGVQHQSTGVMGADVPYKEIISDSATFYSSNYYLLFDWHYGLEICGILQGAVDFNSEKTSFLPFFKKDRFFDRTNSKVKACISRFQQSHILKLSLVNADNSETRLTNHILEVTNASTLDADADTFEIRGHYLNNETPDPHYTIGYERRPAKPYRGHFVFQSPDNFRVKGVLETTRKGIRLILDYNAPDTVGYWYQVHIHEYFIPVGEDAALRGMALESP